jgi:hypothetical protein
MQDQTQTKTVQIQLHFLPCFVLTPFRLVAGSHEYPAHFCCPVVLTQLAPQVLAAREFRVANAGKKLETSRRRGPVLRILVLV